jgi:hypothetical protein
MSKYLLPVFVGLPLQAKLLHSSSRNRHAVAPVVGSVGWIVYLKFTPCLDRLWAQAVEAFTVPVGSTTLKR